MDNAEHAIAIARVSSVKQREEDQRPGLTAYAERKGYTLDAMVPIHGKSAFHGRHVKATLAAVDEHVRNGTATVVIFRHVDRSSREGAFEGYDLIKKIMEAGARVEFSEQEYLNNQPGMLGIFFEMGKEESKIKSDRKMQGNQARERLGKLNGKTAWGYDVADGVLVPNAIGREWIPKIYHYSADGRSLRSITTELKECGIGSPRSDSLWHDASLRRMIANPTYKGDRIGKGEMKYEALVSAGLWAQANLAVKDRIRGGRGAVKRPSTLLKPICGECYGVKRDGCQDGRSPMYRVTRYEGYEYYVCKGHGPQRKSCGAKVILCRELDALVTEFFMLDIAPHTTTVYHPAVDNDKAIEEISRQIRKADADGNDERIEELVSLRKGLKVLPITPAWKEEKPSGLTRAMYFASLDHEGKREMLAKVPMLARKHDGVTAFSVEFDGDEIKWWNARAKG